MQFILILEKRSHNLNSLKHSVFHGGKSHSIIQFVLEVEESFSGQTMKRISKLCFANLATSEKFDILSSPTAKENFHINKSILALGRCIENIEKSGKVTARYIPFRDSVLTQALQECLQGENLTSVITTLNPNPQFSFETYSTLIFADKIRKNSMQKNKTANLEMLEFELSRLEKEYAKVLEFESKYDECLAIELTKYHQPSNNFEDIIHKFQKWKISFEEELESRRSDIESIISTISEIEFNHRILSEFNFDVDKPNIDDNLKASFQKNLEEKRALFRETISVAKNDLLKLSDMASISLSASEYRKFNMIVNLTIDMLKYEDEKDALLSYRRSHNVCSFQKYFLSNFFYLEKVDRACSTSNCTG
jgi:hypothetical protein